MAGTPHASPLDFDLSLERTQANGILAFGRDVKKGMQVNHIETMKV